MEAEDARYLICRSVERMTDISDDIGTLLATGDPDIETKLHRMLTELGTEVESAQWTLAEYLKARIREVLYEEQEHGGLL